MRHVRAALTYPVLAAGSPPRTCGCGPLMLAGWRAPCPDQVISLSGASYQAKQPWRCPVTDLTNFVLLRAKAAV